MRVHATEEEQLQVIKKWWNDYGKYIALAILIGLLVGFGWRYWHQQKIKTAERASIIYQAMTVANAKKDFTAAERFGLELIDKYKDTPYAILASLLMADEDVSNQKLDKALTKLNWTIKHSRIASFSEIARLRAARILLQKQKFKEALAMLSIISDPLFEPLIDSVTGDIYSAMGETKKAKTFYRKAQSGLSPSGETDPYLQLKLAS